MPRERETVPIIDGQKDREISISYILAVWVFWNVCTYHWSVRSALLIRFVSSEWYIYIYTKVVAMEGMVAVELLANIGNIFRSDDLDSQNFRQSNIGANQCLFCLLYYYKFF